MGAGALVWAQTYTFTLLGERLTRRLRGATYTSILRQPMAFFDDKANATGRLTSRLAGDAVLVKATVGERVGILLQTAASLVAGYIIAFIATWRLALVLVAISPLLTFGAFIQSRLQQAGTRAKDVALADAGNIAVEAVSSMRTVAAFNMQARIHARFVAALEEPTTVAIRQGIQGGLYTFSISHSGHAELTRSLDNVPGAQLTSFHISPSTLVAVPSHRDCCSAATASSGT